MTNPTPPWPQAGPDDVLALLQGNQDATRFVLDIAFVSHVYDDLIDGQAPGDERVHATMWKLLVAVPTNAFFRTHEAMLRPVLITGILNWRAANDMEATGSVEELRIAHAVRYSIADVLLLTMALVGGQEYAAANARKARLMSQYDTWAHYRAEHAPKEQTP